MQDTVSSPKQSVSHAFKENASSATHLLWDLWLLILRLQVPIPISWEYSIWTKNPTTDKPQLRLVFGNRMFSKKELLFGNDSSQGLLDYLWQEMHIGLLLCLALETQIITEQEVATQKQRRMKAIKELSCA